MVSVKMLGKSAGSSVSLGMGEIKMTESRRPFALTPDSRHPVCAHTFPHTHTHTLKFSNSCSHVVLHTEIYAHTG